MESDWLIVAPGSGCRISECLSGILLIGPSPISFGFGDTLRLEQILVVEEDDVAEAFRQSVLFSVNSEGLD